MDRVSLLCAVRLGAGMGVAIGILFAGNAHAAEWGVGASATVGATDNALMAPKGDPNARADGFVTGRVAGNIRWERASGTHEATASADISSFFRGSQSTFTQQQLGLSSRMTPTGATALTLSVGALHGRLGFLDPTPTAQAAMPNTLARPGGTLRYGALFLREALAWQLGPQWRASQEFSASGFMPLEDDSVRAKSVAVENQLGLYRVFRVDDFGGTLRLGYGYNLAVQRQDVVIAPAFGLAFADANAAWRRTWTQQWQSEVAVGGFVAKADERSLTGGPGGKVQVQYTDEQIATFIARAERRVFANVFIGEALLSEGADLQVMRALGRFGTWSAAVMGGYQRARPLSGVSQYGHLSVWNVRGGLSWDNQGLLRASLNYLFADQRVSGLAGADMMRVSAVSFQRHLVSVTLEVRWPEPRNAAAGK